MMKKLMAEIWFQFNFRRDVLARIENLDARLAALEKSSIGSKPKRTSLNVGAQNA